VILHVLFIGAKAQQLADKVKVPSIEQFRIECAVARFDLQAFDRGHAVRI
jgi:hypothetical protein